MKKEILALILKSLQDQPKLKRRLKYFAIAGVVGILLTGVLTIWAGVAAVNFVAAQATQIKNIPELRVAECWDKVQSLSTLQPWAERPAVENLAHLKQACLPTKTDTCSDEACSSSEQSFVL